MLLGWMRCIIEEGLGTAWLSETGWAQGSAGELDWVYKISGSDCATLKSGSQTLSHSDLHKKHLFCNQIHIIIRLLDFFFLDFQHVVMQYNA